MKPMDVLMDFLNTYYLLIARFLFVILAAVTVLHIGRCILRRTKTAHVLAVLDIADGATRLPITHYETTIGRSKSCDVVIPLMMVSRQHAVLSMTEDGRWRIVDTKSSGGIFVNGRPLEKDTLINMGDEISLAGMKMVICPPIGAQELENAGKKSKNGWVHRMKARLSRRRPKQGSIAAALVMLNLFQILAGVQLWLVSDPKYYMDIFISFGFLLLVPWIYKAIAGKLGVHNMAAETGAFFLTTLGICTTASAAPSGLLKQLGAVALGLVIFCVMCVILKNLKRVMQLRPYAAGLSLLVLAVNLVIGTTVNGQKNWINLGFMTIQPSEFVKILFIFTGAATLEWLLTAKNLTMLTVYSVGCIGLLFLMGDFGTALIFFFTFIILIFMTSGDVRAIVLTVVTAAMGGLLILSFKPYIIGRFSTWGKVWLDVDGAGFQQTRALMSIASGGLLGLGGGNGFLKDQTVFAASTDLVFGVLCGEWGLLLALLAVLCYILFLSGAIRSHRTTRSSYYIIAACAAAALFLFQASLNIFGTTDVLPITGVTLPFISNGGSSMAASWGLLSFITAALNFERPRVDTAYTSGPEPKRKGRKMPSRKPARGR